MLFVEELSNYTFDKVYLNWSDAYKQTKEGKLWGFVDLSRNFTSATLAKYSPSLYNGTDADVNVYTDSSSKNSHYILLDSLF